MDPGPRGDHVPCMMSLRPPSILRLEGPAFVAMNMQRSWSTSDNFPAAIHSA